MKRQTVVPLVVVGAMLWLSWVVLALFDPDGPRPAEYLGIGYLFGTLFGQTTLAAAWAALGPLPWFVRLPLALLWIMILWTCVLFNIGLHGGPDAEFYLVLAGCLLGQWIVVQLPLWGLALSQGLHVQHRSDAGLSAFPDELPRQLQFGIRQLFVLTAIVAVVLGALRALVLLIIARIGDKGMGEAAIFIFLAVAAVVMTLPLVMAALLPRLAVLATLAVLVLIGVATYWELPLLGLLPKTAGPDMWHFIFINTITSAWIVVIISALRVGGYCLTAVNLGVERRASKRTSM